MMKTSLIVQLFFLNFFFIEMWLNYSIVVITAEQQRDSAVHISMYTFFFIFFSIMIFHKILNIVPCVIQ